MRGRSHPAAGLVARAGHRTKPKADSRQSPKLDPSTMVLSPTGALLPAARIWIEVSSCLASASYGKSSIDLNRNSAYSLVGTDVQMDRNYPVLGYRKKWGFPSMAPCEALSQNGFIQTKQFLRRLKNESMVLHGLQSRSGTRSSRPVRLLRVGSGGFDGTPWRPNWCNFNGSDGEFLRCGNFLR